MKVTDALKLVNSEIALRSANTGKIAEYAERMENGVKFPAIVIGKWPKSDTYGESGIVDGLHRLFAAQNAKVETLDTQTIEFPGVAEMLTYMYTANMAHGLAPTEGQRNARIVMVKKIDPTLTLEKIASQFKLSKSSIDRILKGTQKEGRGGIQTGSKRSKAHKDLEPSKPKAFYALCEKIVHTLSVVSSAADIVHDVTPEGKKGIELNAEKFDLLGETHKALTDLLKGILEAKAK